MNPESNFGYFPEYSGTQVSQLGNVEAENPSEGDVIQWSEIKKQWISKNGSNSWKGTVHAASTGSLTLSGEKTVDGVSLVTGNRILVKNQGNSTNGIYIVSTETWERSTDLTQDSDASGTSVFVNAGSTNGDTIWVCTNNSGSATVGTDTLVFSSLTAVTGAAGSNTQVQFNSSGSLAANSSLTFNAGSGTLNSTSFTDGSAILTNGHLTIQDNKQLRVGTSSDLTIETDGSNTNISSNTGDFIVDNTSSTGDTVIRLGSNLNSTAFRIENNSASALLSVSGNGPILLTGAMLSTNTTESTSAVTGSIITSGGIGVTKNLFSGGTITGNTITDGTVSITGGAISNASNVFSANLTTTTGATNLASGGGATLGFYGVTPIVKPTTSIAAATFVANSSGISNDTATYGGYTMGQVVQALKNLGALT